MSKTIKFAAAVALSFGIAHAGVTTVDALKQRISDSRLSNKEEIITRASSLGSDAQRRYLQSVVNRLDGMTASISNFAARKPLTAMTAAPAKTTVAERAQATRVAAAAPAPQSSPEEAATRQYASSKDYGTFGYENEDLELRAEELALRLYDANPTRAAALEKSISHLPAQQRIRALENILGANSDQA